MSVDFTIGSLTVAPNSKVQTWFPVVNSDEKLPLTLINGAKPGKTALITAGVHGGEYPGIEAAMRLANSIDPAEVSGRIAIISCVNSESFFTKTQYYNPIDGVNLNRVFPGKALGTLCERLAYTISSHFYPEADLYLDLHSGDLHEDLLDFVIYSQVGSDALVASAREMASLLGVEHIVGSTSITGTFGSAANVGIPALLGEIGCCGRWSEADVAQYIWGVKNILRHFGILAGAVERKPVTYYKRAAGVAVGATGVWHPAVVKGQQVAEGQLLGEIVALFGKTLCTHTAPCAGPVLYVVSSLSVREGEALAAIGDPEATP